MNQIFKGIKVYIVELIFKLKPMTKRDKFKHLDSAIQYIVDNDNWIEDFNIYRMLDYFEYNNFFILSMR